MDHSQDLIRYYLQGIRHVTNATSTTLYVPAPSTVSAHTLLVHEGRGSLLPELLDRASAQAFSRRVENQQFELVTDIKGLAFFLGPNGSAVVSESRCGLLCPLLLGLGALGLPELEEDDTPTRSHRRRRRQSDLRQAKLGKDRPAAWLALNFPDEATMRAALDSPRPPDTQAMEWMLSLGGAIGRHLARVRSVLHDSLTGLPGLAELHQMVGEFRSEALNGGPIFSLLMLSPLDFGSVNLELGQVKSDLLLNDIARTVRSSLRNTDFMARFGGAVFAILLPEASEDNAVLVAARILGRAHGQAEDEQNVSLGFRCGISVFSMDQPQQPQLLIQQAAQALNHARTRNASTIEKWQQDEQVSTHAIDPLTSVLTGDMTRDYRRMALMWETVRAIASHVDPTQIINSVVNSIRSTFRADAIYIYQKEPSSMDLRLMQSAAMKSERPESASNEPTQQEMELIQDSVGAGHIVGCGIEGVQDAEVQLSHAALCVPMISGVRNLGCIYLARHQPSGWLDVTDVLFIQGLATQLAVALDRAILGEQERQSQEARRQKLRVEFDTLREAFGKSKLVYKSAAMDSLLSSARTVAGTDATVLITGQSGTGKGVLARTIHNLSQRHDRPFVTVDCSSIAPSLIENELFGHVRGAYTGAQRDSIGRIAEAKGGTVFIDEIGELPMEVQGRLLTFVQEHRFTPVGATRFQQVDVRIIAATNRDLEQEVLASRFRQDLYYRLNVVTFAIPPLCERREEIPLLARYFIEQFSLQYQKRIVGLSRRAEQALLEHPWPGNIRQLQNVIMRAVIMCTQDVLDIEELNLPKPALAAIAQPYPAQAATLPTTPPAAAAAPTPPVPEPAGPEIKTDPSAQLEAWLIDDVRAAIAEYPTRQPPLYTWLTQSMVEASQNISLEQARSRSGSVTRRAAKLLGVPESTYRRRLNDLNSDPTRAQREGIWTERNSTLEELIDADKDTISNLLELWKKVLLAEIFKQSGGDMKVTAALMSATTQTVRKWCKGLKI